MFGRYKTFLEPGNGIILKIIGVVLTIVGVVGLFVDDPYFTTLNNLFIIGLGIFLFWFGIQVDSDRLT